jgi:hypothetical protein
MNLYQKVKQIQEEKRVEVYANLRIFVNDNYPDLLKLIQDNAAKGYITFDFPVQKREDGQKCVDFLRAEGFDFACLNSVHFSSVGSDISGFKLSVWW